MFIFYLKKKKGSFFFFFRLSNYKVEFSSSSYVNKLIIDGDDQQFQ
jgi:uncharacterized protein YegP (UPF0339 family)